MFASHVIFSIGAGASGGGTCPQISDSRARGAQQNLWEIYSGQQMPNFATSEYVLYKIALLQKNYIGVFMRHKLQTFCFKFMMVYSAKQREYIS